MSELYSGFHNVEAVAGLPAFGRFSQRSFLSLPWLPASLFWLWLLLCPISQYFCDQSPACPHHLLCCSSDPGGSGYWPLGISYLSTPHARPDPDEDSMCFSPEPPWIPVCRITQENQKCAVIFWLHFLFMNSDVLFSSVEMREEQNYNNWSNFWWLKNNQQTIYNSPCVMYEPKCYLVMLISQKCYIIMLLFF